MKINVNYSLVLLLLCSGTSLHAWGKPKKQQKPQRAPHQVPVQQQQVVQQTAVAQQTLNQFMPSAVTYDFSGGRFGDNLISYAHAKWLEYKYNVRLLYKPFKYSDQLMMHVMEQPYNASVVNHYQRTVKFEANHSLEIQPRGHLYVVPYFPECMEELRKPDTGIHPMRVNRDLFQHFAIDWEDQTFVNILRKTIYPRQSLNLICPPTDCVSIAVHVRKNSGGFDTPLLQDIADEQLMDPRITYDDVGFPLKHVPDEYHIENLKFLVRMFEGQKIYAFIFTEDPNPAALAEKYAKAVNNENIIFDYRRGENGHTANVLEDLFSIMQFDCLIRGDSNLAIIAGRLGHFKVVISPLHHKWNRTKLNIDKTNIIINNDL